MNHTDRAKFIELQFERMMEITKSKGVEYANSDNDANANFKEIAEKLGISPKMVCWVYTMKHIQSIASYIKNGEVFSEPIEGRIHDACLYLLILSSLIEEDKNAKNH